MELRLKTLLVLLMAATLAAAAACVPNTPTPVPTATSTPVPTPTPLPRQSKIAFVSLRDGQPRIYVMNPDGSNVARVSQVPATAALLAWSPDGSKLAFQSVQGGEQGLYVANANGSGEAEVARGNPFYNKIPSEMYPSWAPDGSSIVYQHVVSDGSTVQNPEIRVATQAETDGANQTEHDTLLADGMEPAWSPDGSKIAYISVSGSQGLQVSVMNRDGSNQTMITHLQPGTCSNPVWSPDGTKIAFVAFPGRGSDIYVVNADGSGLANVTEGNGDVNSAPAWSPDGTKIAFEWVSRDLTSDPSRYIFLMNPDGSNKTRLTHGTMTAEYHPSWSPDGSMIVFSDRTTGLYVVDDDGSNLREIANDPSWAPGEFAWSPWLNNH